ncbi:MAG: NapC/NirT family cytochrome c [Coriobacteriia bacterium]|nr:NapC/NirT family cytochrome c [Coriobacteriia bacterium]
MSFRRPRPIEAFRNPASRPRAIIWVATVTIAFLLFVTVAVAATTAFWFCADICHSVQVDTINSYLNSTHDTVACVSCHIKPGADPVTFLWGKAKKLAELPPTIMGTYDMPLNPVSQLAMSGVYMGSQQCMQCHQGGDRFVTPSYGIIMDHDIHADNDIACAVCHNRVGHQEQGIELVGVNPQTGEAAFPHPDYMDMKACYRCHRLEADGLKDGLAEFPTPLMVSGACELCHPPEFDLVPPSHYVERFVEDVHGPMAIEEEEGVRQGAELVAAAFERHNYDEKSTPEGDAVRDIPNSLVINDCYTCHAVSFCDDCHLGVRMPHPENYLELHVEDSVRNMAGCELCHGGPELVCVECHHTDPWIPGYQLDPTRSWLAQHWDPCAILGAAMCFDCHDPVFCAYCHVNGFPPERR